MRTFFILQKRNFQASLSRGDFLQRVEILKLLFDAFMQDRVGESEETASRPDFVCLNSVRESFADLHFLRNALAPVDRRIRMAG